MNVVRADFYLAEKVGLAASDESSMSTLFINAKGEQLLVDTSEFEAPEGYVYTGVVLTITPRIRALCA